MRYVFLINRSIFALGKMMNKKIKLGFVKFGGMAAGGTEKFLQNIAMNLPSDKFEVTYFYCDAASYVGSDWKHPDTDENRLRLMEDSTVILKKFNVAAKNVTVPTHDWLETDFFDQFDESEYDIVVSGRAGHPEYPFTQIRSTPIVDTIHLTGLVDKQENIAAVVHVSEWNKQAWVKAGGNEQLAEVIYLPIVLPTELPEMDFRSDLGLEGKFIFGMHQRPNDGIYSHIPLAAYMQIQTDNTAFVLLGGSQKYNQQAELLGLKNFHQLEPTGDMGKVCRFLEALDVYTHGRADGENNSQSIAEAMSFGKPIVSHLARANGHVETIGNAGIVVNSVEDYAEQMKNLMIDEDYRTSKGSNALRRFETSYNLETNIQRFTELFERVYSKSRTFVADDVWLNEWMDEKDG